MNLKEVKEMFKVGDTWDVVNSYAISACGRRKVTAVRGIDVVFDNDRHMDWPKASDIIEARPGIFSTASRTGCPISKTIRSS